MNEVVQKDESVWPKTIGIGSLAAVAGLFVSNLDKVTPFVREFGLASFAIMGGMALVGALIYWFAATATRLGERAITAHEQFLDNHRETTAKQSDILDGIAKTQAVHGERLEHHTNILEELRRDRGQRCTANLPVNTMSPGDN